MSEFNTRTREGVDEWMEKLSEAGVTDEHLVQCFAVALRQRRSWRCSTLTNYHYVYSTEESTDEYCCRRGNKHSQDT